MTLFANVNSRRGHALVTLGEWMQRIRTDRDIARLVEKRRECLKNGQNNEADRIKRSLPALVAAGNCLTGRKVESLTGRTGIAPFDFDHVSEDLLEEVRQKLPQYAWVKAVHRTCSQDGLRVFVNVGVVHPDIYADAYRKVAEWFRTETGLSYDPACKDLCRLSFAAADAGAYYADRTEVFPYPEGFRPFDYTVPAGEDFSEAHHYPKRLQEENRIIRIGDFLRRFLRRNPFEEGRRHTSLVRMGQEARWRHLTREDLEVLKREAYQTLGQLSPKEYQDALEWGYNHSEEAPLAYMEKVHKVQRFTRAEPDRTEKAFPWAEEEADGRDSEEEALSTAPYFDPEAVQSLPSIFLRGMEVASTRRQRDALLLGMLAVLSGCVPGVRVRYADKELSPHLYAAVLGPAGAGKGIIAYAAELAQPIHRELLAQWKKEMKEYQEKQVDWEQEVRKALREKRRPDTSLRVEEPPRRALLVPPNTSKSQLIADLETAGETGLICFTSEMDAFSAAVSTEYGKHAPELRMIYHHEPVGLNYKVDGRMLYVAHPRLAICMSGTLQQLVNFVPSREDGMMSRISLYMLPGTPEWVSAEPNGKSVEQEKLFGELGKEVAGLFHFLEKYPTEVIFTEAQWRMHDERFTSLLERVLMEEEENTQAIVNRHGLMVARIAALLTAIRKYEQHATARDCLCLEGDFRTALSLVQTLLVHSLRISTMLDSHRGKRHPMRIFHQVQRILDGLPETFSYTQFLEATALIGKSRSTAKRTLDRAVEAGLIEKLENGYRKLTH